MPGIMTGMILAIARGAGEVAPLMLVGAVKLAPKLPLSASPSDWFGLSRSFMHLGFHIYDLGFQSRNAEAAKSMVYTTTFLLIAIVVILNLMAMGIRYRTPKNPCLGTLLRCIMTAMVEMTDAKTDAAKKPMPDLPLSIAGDGALTQTHPEVDRETAVVKIEDFCLYYGKSKALHNIQMSIPAGKVTALIGPSGCGKSTLLRSVNRLNDLIDTVRIEGNMYLNGDPIYSRNVDVIELRKRMGMVFQKSNPFPMSIFENVVYSLRIDGENRKGVLQDICEKSLRGAALWDEAKDRLHTSALSLSGGQQQRLCIARAIAADPGGAADGRALFGAGTPSPPARWRN